MWRENCEVDLEYHVRPYRVASPGGRRELDEAVGKIASTPLDRARPLWEMYFIEGLADGRIAVLGKITTRWRTALPRRTFSRAAWTRRPTRPFTPPPSFMNHMVDATRKFATATLALADVKETGKQLGVTINDMVLAVSTGALRNLLLRHDGHGDHPLLASVPVSFDFSPDRISGNYFTGVMMVLPVELDDPLERVRAVHDAAVSAKETHHLMGPELVSRWAAYFPPAPAEALFRWLANKDGQNKVLNLPISNVPGPREHGRVGGALVTEIYSVGPLTTGSGLNITVWSYVDQLNVSVLSDGATLEDPHELTDAMVKAFVEIRSAAGLSEELTVVEGAMAP